MDRQLGLLLACIGILLLAGCMGFAPADDETPSSSDDELSPSTPGAGENDDSDTLPDPPGVTDGTVTDVDALLAAHATALEDESVTIGIAYELAVDGDMSRVAFTGRSIPDDDRLWIEFETDDASGVYYVEDGVTYAMEREGGTTHYRQGASLPMNDVERFGSDEYIGLALSSAEFVRVGHIVHADSPVIEFDAETVEIEEMTPDAETISRSASGTLLVDSSGVVHSTTVSERIQTTDGQTYEFRLHVTIENIGSTSIDRPDWYDRAAS